MLAKDKEGTLQIYNGQKLRIPDGEYEVEIGCGYGGGIDAELVPIKLTQGGFTREQLIAILGMYGYDEGIVTPASQKLHRSIMETLRNLLKSDCQHPWMFLGSLIETPTGKQTYKCEICGELVEKEG